MLTPTKHTNLDLSVLNIGGMIIKQLCACPILPYNELEEKVTYLMGDSVKPIFMNALSFLFLLGKINYKPQTDAIELLEK